MPHNPFVGAAIPPAFLIWGTLDNRGIAEILRISPGQNHCGIVVPMLRAVINFS